MRHLPHYSGGSPGARALAGPSLWGMADRGYIGGVLPNTTEAMVRWLQNPQAVTPRTIMPNMDVPEADARQHQIDRVTIPWRQSREVTS